MQQVRRHREPMALGVVVGPRDLGDVAPPFVMPLGLPARQAAALVDERPRVEVADAADVRIERQVAAETQHHRHPELHDLLPVPAGHQVEAAEERKEFALRADIDMDVREARQFVRRRCASVAGDTISSSNGLRSRQCLASDSIRRPARSMSPRRVILRRARGRMACRTSENIIAWLQRYMWGTNPSTSIAWRVVRRRLPAAQGPKAHATERDVSPRRISVAPKKTPGQRPGESNREASRLGDVGS